MNETLKTRRQFLKTSLAGGAMAWTVPAFLAHTFDQLDAEAADKLQPVTGKDGPVLVVLQMAGGNDGLNTVVPYANDHYQRSRPRLKLGADRVLKINDALALHPALTGLKSLLDSGHLSIVQGVGYPNPNRSHFRSTEIWQTASDAERFEKYGWIGRYFDNACKGSEATVGVNIGRQTPQAFSSSKPLGISLDNPERYKFATGGDDENQMEEKSFREMNRPDETLEAGGSIGAVAGASNFKGSALDYLERTALDAQVSSDRIREISKSAKNLANYPASALASSMKLVARLIQGNLPTRVYYVSQGGYDTHTNQLVSHERLLREMGDALQSFVADLKAQGNFSRVTILTFSEFGRRVAENANQGTDHGAASSLFLIGEKIKPGLHGTYPSLAPADLKNGDLKHSVDFRSVYAGVLEDWLKTPSQPVLGKKFEPLKLFNA